MNTFTSVVLTATILTVSPIARAQNTTIEKPFPFVMPWDDGSKTIVDVSFLNPAPLDEKRRLTIKDGHFRDATNRRVRFLGTNLTAGACFPPREDAPKIAARLRKYGFNCVRLHHMDAPWATPNIFHFEGNSFNKPTTELSPQSMERLDWFIYQLKLHGIYVDLNLHVTRQWNEADGFPEAANINGEGKVVSYFYPRAIELQQRFARQLLGHLNPHTKQTYAQEPSVAVVEMTNEDTLLGQADAARNLPAPYRDELQKRWNGWLLAQYKNNGALLEKWNRDAQPLGEELLGNNRFSEGSAGWTVERHDGTDAELTTENVAGATNAPEGRVLKFHPIKTNGTNWHLQLHYTGLNLQDEQIYTVSFAARAAAPRTVALNARYDIEPWSMVGLDSPIALDTNWKRFNFSFKANDPSPNHTRLSLMLGEGEADIYIGDISLKSGGGGVNLENGQNLETANVPLPSLTDTLPGRDYAHFLRDVEADYTRIMRQTIRETGSRAPVFCSQASYGGVGGVWRESQQDVVDMHAYWQHPNFPNKAWDMNDYRIDNTSMIGVGALSKNSGALGALAMHRVEGKPFWVTEYDHSAPSEYAAETIPLIFAYAASQDWDGVFLFSYGGESDYRRDKINNFFDHSMHPAKMAFLPGAAQMWLRGYLGRNPQTQTLTLPAAAVDRLVAARTDYSFWNAALKDQLKDNPQQLVNRHFFDYRSALRFDVAATTARIERKERDAKDVSAKELDWGAARPFQVSGGRIADTAQSIGARLLIQTPGAKGAIGFLGGLTTKAGEDSKNAVQFEVAPSARNYASLLLTSMDGKPTHLSQSLLLAAIDKAENIGLAWNAERTFAGDAWKSGPVQSFGVTAKISVPTNARFAKVQTLDATGKMKGVVASQLKKGVLQFSIAPDDKTLWYHIVLTP